MGAEREGGSIFTKGHEVGIPTCPPIICVGSGRTCHMHYASVLTRPAIRVSNTKSIFCIEGLVEEVRNLSMLDLFTDF